MNAGLAGSRSLITVYMHLCDTLNSLKRAIEVLIRWAKNDFSHVDHYKTF